VVKSVTVPGKCSAISDGDRAVFPSKIHCRKRKGNSIPDSPQNRNLTPVTIMVADSIGAGRSRRSLKV
jgi:hypothetical protein